jgi:hypothetical protein
MGNDERPKRSWRDIDKRRDGSSSGGRVATSGPAEPRSGSHEEHRQKQYRAALEAAFAKGEVGKFADKLNISGLGPEKSQPPPERTPPPAPAADAEAGDGETAAATTPAAAPGPAASGKPGGKRKAEDEKLGLRRKLVEAAGRQEISRTAEKYLARFPLPDDHELLEQLLEHEKETRIREAITRIGELLERRQMPRRSRALCGKLKYIIETTADNDLRQAAQGLLDRLA